MQQALVFVGIGALVILIGVIMVDRGFTHTSDNEIIVPMESSLMLSSTAFLNSASIPVQYTCDGVEVSPPLTITGAPEGTKSFAIVVEDPDVPKLLKPDGLFLHWIVFNIPAHVTEIIEGATVGVVGANETGKNSYIGPCPPQQYEPSEHRYIFTLYALDIELPLVAGAPKKNVMNAMQGHILAQTQLIGKYKRR